VIAMHVEFVGNINSSAILVVLDVFFSLFKWHYRGLQKQIQHDSLQASPQ
jgi:hypothetical protein